MLLIVKGFIMIKLNLEYFNLKSLHYYYFKWLNGQFRQF